MNLRLTIADGVSPRLQSVMRMLTASGLSGMHQAAGVEVQRLTRDHIAALKRKPGSMASKFGAPPSNHYAQAAEKVAAASALSAGPAGATLTINHKGFARAFRSVKISPTTSQSLALPIHPASFGHRAAALWDRMGLFIPKGKRVIAATIGGVLTPLYILLKFLTQKQDRSLLPSDQQLQDAAVTGARGWLGMALRKGGKI